MSGDDKQMEKIENIRLTLEDVPPPNAGWQEIQEFALTFDGYQFWGSFEKCAEIANAHRNHSLVELRTCLFFEQRRWRHFGEEPDEKAMDYIMNLINEIRKKVAASDVD